MGAKHSRPARSATLVAVALFAALLAGSALAAGRTRVPARAADVAGDSPPSVYVNTMAPDPTGSGKYGILVGDQFIAPKSEHEWLQIAVFDRSTMAYLPDQSRDFDCPEAQDHPWADLESLVKPCVNKVGQYLSDLAEDHNGRYIVIAASPRAPETAASQPPVGVAQPLRYIGVVPPSYRGSLNAPLRVGTFSAIGVLDIGNVYKLRPYQNAGGELGRQSPGDGAITGYFLRNNVNQYEFAPNDRVAFTTQAGAGESPYNVIQVGGHRYQTDLTPLRGDIQAIVLNRRTLELEREETVANAANPGQIRSTLEELHRLNDLLADANANDNSLVILTTNRSMALIHNNNSYTHLLEGIANHVEELGGTRRRFFDAVDPSLDTHHYSYTLIGSSRLGFARGIESQGENVGSSGGRASLNTAPVSGTLVRDNQWNYAVADTAS